VGNSAGDGCAQCLRGFFQASGKCMPCPAGAEQTTTYVAIGFAFLMLCALWRITRVGKDERALGDAETTRDIAHALSNTAILMSIVLSHVNLSFMAFQLPVGRPAFLVDAANWVVGIFSFDFAMLTVSSSFAHTTHIRVDLVARPTIWWLSQAPECQLQDMEPIDVMAIKFALTHVVFMGMLASLGLFCWKCHRHHVTNASLALYTLSIGALTKSCVSSHLATRLNSPTLTFGCYGRCGRSIAHTTTLSAPACSTWLHRLRVVTRPPFCICPATFCGHSIVSWCQS
jgi:hypothetical protein